MIILYQDNEVEILKLPENSYSNLYLNHPIENYSKLNEIVQEYNIKSVSVSHNYVGNIDWIADYLPKIEHLNVIGSNVEINNINELRELKTLRLDTVKNFQIDFQKLDKLIYLQVVWQESLRESFIQESSIKGLSLKYYNHENLELIANQYKVEELYMTYANRIKSLQGIAKMKSVNFLSIYTSKSLEDLSHIDHHENLKYLHLYKCNNIKNIPILSNTKVEEFAIDCKTLSSLSPLKYWKNLKGLIFTTKILDDDIEVLRTIDSLQSVSFVSKKSYNFSEKDMKDFLVKKDITCEKFQFRTLKNINFYRTQSFIQSSNLEKG